MQQALIDYESMFVHSFVTKSRQERVLFELSNTERRSDCLRSFSEFHKQRLQRAKLHMLSNKCSCKEVKDEITALGYSISNQVYILHFNPYYDRKILSFQQALKQLWFTGPCVIVFSDGKLALCIFEMGVYPYPKALLY